MPPPAEAATRVASATGMRLLSRYGPTLLLLVICLAVGAYAATATPYFFSSRNLSNLAVQVAPLTIVALGQFSVIMLGGIDLSAGPNISLSTAVASFLVIAEAPLGLTGRILAVLAVGAVVGIVNALLIVFLKLPDLIATLSTFSAVAGVALIVRPAPGGLVDYGFADAVLIRWGSLPFAFVVVMVVLFEVVLLRAKGGLRLIATGSSEEAAFAVGVPTDRVRTMAYVFCGVMAALAGLVVAARIGSGDPQSGTNFTLMSVTAVVLPYCSRECHHDARGPRGFAAALTVSALPVFCGQ